MKNNPYVGPRPYKRGERNFYGRSREARDLLSLILAERVVLFYAPSGAGKTSLLNAQIIPALEEEGFHVLPAARVGSDLPPGIDPRNVENVFVFSALMGLAGEEMPAELIDHTLLSFLRQACPQEADDPDYRPPILILDQFEEILTAHRDQWRDVRGFFEQLREALREMPTLGVIFALGEDHVAGLDPYAPLLPRRLRARFRMERLDHKGALEAVAKPALDADCPFDEGVAERLVADLRRIKVQRLGHAGEAEEHDVPGPYVEPVQLQVVCQQLWANLPDQRDNAIQWKEVEEYGNIDRALTDFYESALDAAMRRTGVSERRLRRWFSQQLITPVETRGLAMQGPEDTAGLSNAAVDVLEDLHLIRSDVRAGARWYELVHDRLIDPILASNQAWEAVRETPLRATARRWQETKDPSLLIYREESLAKALAWVEANPDEVEPFESEFLEASQQAEQERIRRRRLRRAVTIALATGLVVVASLVILALFQSNRANEQARIAVARQLLVQAEVKRNRGSWTLASLLAVESMRRLPGLEVSMTLNRLLEGFAEPVIQMGHEQGVNVSVLSPDGRWVVSGGADGTARVWEVETGREVARMEHWGDVWAVVFSPDGQWVATGSGEIERDSAGQVVASSGEVRVWDAATGDEVARMEHQGWVTAVAFSPDGRRVASGSWDRTARVWDAATGDEVARMEHEGWVRAVAFGPNGRSVVSGGDDGIARVWDAATGDEAAQMEHRDIVRTVAFSPDGQLVASGSDDQTVQVWEAATGKELARLDHNGRVFALTFSSDGQWVISGSDDWKARVWEVGTWRERAVMRVHWATVVDAVLSSDGRWLVTGSNDRTARVWDASTGEEVARMEHEKEVTSVAFVRDDQWVVSGGRDGAVRVWNVSTMLNEKRVVGREVARMAHDGRVNVLAISPDGQSAVSGGEDGAMWLWSIGAVPNTRLATRREMEGMGSGVRVVAYSPDGQWLISGSDDGTVQAWEAATGRAMGRAKHGWEANAVAFSPDGQWVVSGGGDGTVLVWEMTSGHEMARMDHGWEANSVVFTPDGEQVVSASRDGTVVFWDVATGREVERVVYPSPWRAVALSADGQWVASGGHDGTVRVWEVTTGREVARMEHEPELFAVAFSFDGRWVMSSSDAGTVRVWEAGSGREVSLVEHALGYADAVTFSPDGRWIVIISYDTAWVRWWKPEDLIAQVCDNLFRNLTFEEWGRYIGGEPYRPTCLNLPVPEE